MQDGPSTPTPDPTPRGPRPATGAPSGGDMAGMGLQFVVAILLFLWLGEWVDGKLGTGPAGVIVGVFVGAGGAFYAMYRKVIAAQREYEERRKK